MYEPYDNAEEQARHVEAIKNLATETQQAPDLVRFHYESAYLRLKPHTKVMDYLPLFVARRTREALERAAS